ncbi:MAG: tetratricopeptide repeat protein, partial [Gammaproteobacteria bacterium]|nr:tetratricopeptide repeat protein [Gammaproteobacteria bacterium]
RPKPARSSKFGLTKTWQVFMHDLTVFVPALNAQCGQYAKALEYNEQALAIHREIGDRRGEGRDLGNIGVVYGNLDQYKALEYYEQALVIIREIGDRRNEGTNLGNIGNAYSNLGQYAKALEYYEQALAIGRKIGDRRSAELAQTRKRLTDERAKLITEQNRELIQNLEKQEQDLLTEQTLLQTRIREEYTANGQELNFICYPQISRITQI